jgi:multidrug efflux pump subunit AcrA (membrane-fusion protein)
VVESVAVNLGQSVKKGQLLAVIASQQISDQRSEQAAAQRRLALARTTYEREKQLWQDKISAEQDFSRLARRCKKLKSPEQRSAENQRAQRQCGRHRR